MRTGGGGVAKGQGLRKRRDGAGAGGWKEQTDGCRDRPAEEAGTAEGRRRRRERRRQGGGAGREGWPAHLAQLVAHSAVTKAPAAIDKTHKINKHWLCLK